MVSQDSVNPSLHTDLGTSARKRPALSSEFSHLVTESSLNRQRVTLQGKSTELENRVAEKERYIDKLEADRRRLVDKEDELLKEKESEREVWEGERVCAP